MGIPVPFSRAQQIVGFPEHPCEAIIKNGAIYTPYEEMEVRFFPEHLGAVVALYIGDGENRELFGRGKSRASASLKKGYLPDVTHETEQLGCRIRQTVFGTLIDGDRVKDGTEPLICMISVEVTNFTGKIINLTLNVKFGTCFVPQVTEDDYWHNFLKRNDVWSDFDADNELQPYPVPITERGGMLYAEGLGLLFVPERSCGGKPATDGWNFELPLTPGKARRVTYRLPYYPIDACYAASVASLDYDQKCAETDAVWEGILTRGMQLDIPGTPLGNLFRAQTAMTFLLIDRQNKGSSSLYGCEMYRSWADRYPDKVLCYPHLSPSLYEFIWAQEAAFWVLGALDLQGYHSEVEEYLEVFFALQGEGTPGVYDKSVLPDKSAAASYMGTTPHSWLNSTGGVLCEIARHYLLTRNDVWFDEHKDSVISACRWISILRESVKKQETGSGYGIMPRGQSTDCTFASDHLQWYYTDIGTIRGLKDITEAAEMRGWNEAPFLRKEYEDYRICLLRSVDTATRDFCDFKKDSGNTTSPRINMLPRSRAA